MSWNRSDIWNVLKHDPELVPVLAFLIPEKKYLESM